MVDTKILTKVQHELEEGFLIKYNCVSIPKNETNGIFLEMEPDLVAYDKNKGILYIGEITVSGCNGNNGKDRHIGGMKKFTECFSKFYLLKLEENSREINKKIKALIPDFNIKTIECHLIVPAGCKFIKALGWWRERLLKTEIMLLDEIPLSKITQGEMEGTLQNARNEMPHK
ncbi:MAG: hypothetical protein O8C64_12445 [Candidatus Methanoperedens sp.]|nr:hypothetical protein [Candidatus Methanoperedens sp.]MCZ7404945.1 hypothetical protein [Candidatus Methanoperedens sp.]